MSSDPFPDRIQDRDGLMALLARTTNYEEKLPRDPAKRLFKLERVEQLMDAAGTPQDGPRIVHIAGSKGKGTVARIVAQVLTAIPSAGPIGLYTSPHLQDLTERVIVDNVAASDATLARAATRLLPYLAKVEGTADAPTFFELFTAIAWLVFHDAQCRHVVLETGLGGRLDATNICHPAVTVITTIELEHKRLLGDTIEEIAAEKAGIVKLGVPVITTAQGAALDVIRRAATDRGAELTVIGEDVTYDRVRSGPGRKLTFELTDAEGTTPLALPVAGRHHVANAAAAYCALRHLVDAEPIAGALDAVHLPGLLEPVAEDPLVLIDGAHTPRSAEATRDALAEAYPGRPFGLVLALLEEKDLEGVVRPLAEGAAFIVTTPVDSPRAVPAETLAAKIAAFSSVPVYPRSSPAEALAVARTYALGDTIVLASGSIYLAGAVRDAVGLLPGQRPSVAG
ncbi:MAG: Mur ligase family protein [Planctomycetota bacterium]|nr:Mur ligase family protein [Planctomycetota bacterium]